MNPFRKELHLIIEKLKILNLYKVILFGSLAYGNPDNDSDVDLIVVTNDEYYPQNYQEKSDLYLKVSNVLTDIAGKIPIDLVVYTKSMYFQFIQAESLFSKEVLKNGVVLYENDHKRMAEQESGIWGHHTYFIFEIKKSWSKKKKLGMVSPDLGI